MELLNHVFSSHLRWYLQNPSSRDRVFRRIKRAAAKDILFMMFWDTSSTISGPAHTLSQDVLTIVNQYRRSPCWILWQDVDQRNLFVNGPLTRLGFCDVDFEDESGADMFWGCFDERRKECELLIKSGIGVARGIVFSVNQIVNRECRSWFIIIAPTLALSACVSCRVDSWLSCTWCNAVAQPITFPLHHSHLTHHDQLTPNNGIWQHRLSAETSFGTPLALPMHHE